VKEENAERVPITSANAAAKVVDKTATPVSLLRKAKAAATTGKWNEANDTISEALRLSVSEPAESPTHADILLFKGDCQTHLKLFRSAESFYNEGIRAVFKLNMDDPRLPSYFDKLASCYEAAEKTESNIQEAINTRGKSEDQFERTEKSLPLLGVDKDKWQKERQHNREMMAKDTKLLSSVHTK
jgi:hypothetical protein